VCSQIGRIYNDDQVLAKQELDSGLKDVRAYYLDLVDRKRELSDAQRLEKTTPEV